MAVLWLSRFKQIFFDPPIMANNLVTFMDVSIRNAGPGFELVIFIR